MPALPDLESLRLFSYVAHEGSIGAAARRAGLSQPSVSARMARLERQLGVPLLARGSHGSTLTEEGTLIAEWAGDLLHAGEVLLQGAAALRANEAARLRVRASQTVAEYLVPRWLSKLRSEEPGADVQLSVGNSAEVIKAVRDGSCEIGFIESPRLPRDLRTAIVERDELVLVAAAGTPRRTHDADSLRRLVLVTREVGSGTRDTLERAIGALSADSIEMPSNSAVKVAVMSGAGYAVLSRLAVSAEIADGRLIELPLRDVDMSRTIHAVVRRDAARSDLRDRLIVLARR